MSKSFTVGIMCACLLCLLLTVALSMGVFDGREVEVTALTGEKKDVVTFWATTLMGSPDEKIFLELTDEYNRNHPDVFINTILVPWNSYQSKINIAVATGQPPDVCFNAFIIVDGLRAKQKIPDLAVPIPDDMISPRERQIYGEKCLAGLSRNGVLYGFPRTKYLGGGTLRGSREWFDKAGIDIDYYVKHGWDFDTFRDAMIRVQAAMRKEKGPDACAFGLNLLIYPSQYFQKFMPNVLGKEVTERAWLVWNEKERRYYLDPAVTPEALAGPLRLFQQMKNVDHTWGAKTLGMAFDQLEEDCHGKGLLAVTWNDVCGNPISLQIKFNNERDEGLRDKSYLMMNIPIPTPRKGMPLVFGMGAEGYGALKQVPYKGDVHTRHSLEFAKFMSSSYVTAKFFDVRPERWMPWADEDGVHAHLKVKDPVVEDPYLRGVWQQYLDWMKSPEIYTAGPARPDQEDLNILGGKIYTFEYTGQGKLILESVLYDPKKDPEKAAREIIDGLNKIIEAHYRRPPGKRM